MKTLVALKALSGLSAPTFAGVITQGTITVNAAYDGAHFDIGDGTWHLTATSEEFGGYGEHKDLWGIHDKSCGRAGSTARKGRLPHRSLCSLVSKAGRCRVHT